MTASVGLAVATPASAATDALGSAALQLSSLSPGATGVTYTVSFVATDGLTSGSPDGPNASSILLSAPSGTVFTADGSDTCGVYYIYDYTTGQSDSCETPTESDSGGDRHDHSLHKRECRRPGDHRG